MRVPLQATGIVAPVLTPSCFAVVVFLFALVAVATLIAWKLMRNTGLRRELRSQRDILRATFADISHHTVQHCKYAALMAKVGLS